MQTGVPAKPAANVAQAGAGLHAAASRGSRWLLALAGTLAWLWLVRWRTGRHRDALWKSLVLPAGGVALCWLLLMTLWLPLLDYARSYRAAGRAHRAACAGRACIAAPGPAARPLMAALEYFGPLRVDARPQCGARRAATTCVRVEPARRGRPGARAGRASRASAGRPTATT